MSHELEMVCVCSVEGVEQVEARRLRIFRRMNVSYQSALTEALVLSLAFDFSADAEIWRDQWFGVSLRSPPGDLFVQCDDPADGLAALWEHLASAHPERVTSQQPYPPSLRVTERVSAALLAQYKAAEGAYREHRAAAHLDDNYPPCEDCDFHRLLKVKARRVLVESWGSRVLEPAIERAFNE